MPRASNYDLLNDELRAVMVNGSKFSVELPMESYRQAYAFRSKLYALRQLFQRVNPTIVKELTFEAVITGLTGENIPRKLTKEQRETPCILILRPRSSLPQNAIFKAIKAGAEGAGQAVVDPDTVLPDALSGVLKSDSPVEFAPIDDFLKNL